MKFVIGACNAECRKGADGLKITGVSTDSRSVKAGELFFAIRGEKFDAHDFLDEVAAKKVAGVVTTPNLISLLGVAPLLGHGFLTGSEAAASGRQAVLSYALWQRRFSGRQDIIGASISLDREAFTVAGVMP